MKFHVGKKSKRKPSTNASSETTAIPPNNAHHTGENISSPGVIAPNVREEPQLIDEDSLSESKQQISSTSLEVEPGNDPLSRLTGSTSSGEGEGGETMTNSLRRTDFAGSGHQVNALQHHSNHQGSARYGECLSEGDHTNLKGFVHELVGKRLLPHLNEALKSLNEWVSPCDTELDVI